MRGEVKSPVYRRIPGPGRWIEDALCVQIPDAAELFFPQWGRPDTAVDAKAICLRCPVIADCLEYALRYKIEHGIWGGTSPRQREALRRAA